MLWIVFHLVMFIIINCIISIGGRMNGVKIETVVAAKLITCLF